MDFWSWYAFGLILALGLIRYIRRDGAGNFLRSMRLWGEGVSAKQRRGKLVGREGLLGFLVLGGVLW